MTTPEDPGASAKSEGSADPFVTEYELLRRRMRLDPDLFTQVAAIPGCESLVDALQQDDIGQELTHRLWDVLLVDDANSRSLMHFLWVSTLPCKKRFIRGLDRYLSGPYPMFAGLSRKWPGGNSIPPYVRDATERVGDFEMVDQGYLGYLKVGYTEREVELLVWLEALRDRQCSDRPCQVGGRTTASRLGRPPATAGGCPLQVHIPEVLALVGRGHFHEAFELVESCHPLPDLTGLTCPQDEHCRGACIYGAPIPIGQLEAFLPARARLHNRREGGSATVPDPWTVARRPPVAVVGSGPSGLIHAYLLAARGYPVAVFEALPDLGGTLRYRIPEFRLPRHLIDDIVGRITALGGRFIPDFVVGRSASVQDLRAAGYWRVVPSSASDGPRFPDVPGVRLPGILSADEFLLRTNLTGGPYPAGRRDLDLRGEQTVVIGDGDMALDVARTVRRLGGEAMVVREDVCDPSRNIELRYAVEEGVRLRAEAAVTGFVPGEDGAVAGVEVCSSRSIPARQVLPAGLVVVALGGSVGPDAAVAAGAARTAAEDLLERADVQVDDVADRVCRAAEFTDLAQHPHRVIARRVLAGGFVEVELTAPLVARAALPGQFVRVRAGVGDELVPLSLADWDVLRGTVTLVVRERRGGEGVLAAMRVGEELAGLAGPLGRATGFDRQDGGGLLVVVAGGGAPRVHAVVRACLRVGRRVHLVVSGEDGCSVWTGPGSPFDRLRGEFSERLVVWSCGTAGSRPRREVVESLLVGKGPIAGVLAAGPSFFLRSVAEQCRSWGVPCSVVVNSTVVDATGTCGACLVPMSQEGESSWCRACVDGPEMDGHLIDWDRFLPRCPRG